MDLKITFTKDYQLKDEEGTQFKKGSEHSMNEASANHYLRRGAAVLSEKTDEQRPKKAKKKAKKNR